MDESERLKYRVEWGVIKILVALLVATYASGFSQLKLPDSVAWIPIGWFSLTATVGIFMILDLKFHLSQWSIVYFVLGALGALCLYLFTSGMTFSTTDTIVYGVLGLALFGIDLLDGICLQRIQ